MEEKNTKAKKPIFKRWWFWVIIAIVVIGAIGSMGEEDTPNVADKSGEVVESNVSKSNDEEQKQESEPVTKPEVPEFFKVGETVETKKIKAVISEVEKLNGSDFNRPADGNEFVLLHLTIENISDSEISVSSMLSFNSYVDDVTVNESLAAQIAKEGTSTVDGTIAAGKKLKGVLAYEVSKDWEEIEVHFTPDVWDNTAIKWIIENK